LLSAYKNQNGFTGVLETDLSIAVVIPCYNVEKTIAGVVAGLPSYIQWVVLVDDASRDRTAEIVDSLKSERIQGIHLPENQGVGGATLRGYEEALALGADVIVKMDGDGQMDPAYLLPLIAPILMKRADYTKGNRFIHADQIKSMPFIRRIGNAGLSFMTKAASGYWDIFDPTNGYTAIHGSIIPWLNKSLIDRRFFYETSMLMQLYLIRAVVKDVPIPSRYADETSNLSELKAFFEFPIRLLKGLLSRLWFQYFVRDFGIFSIFMVSGVAFFAFGIIFGLYHWIISAFVYHTATPTGTIMLAILPIILGVQFILQGIVLDVQNVPTNPLQNEDTSILGQFLKNTSITQQS